MFRRPASICLSGPSEVFVPVLIGGIFAGLTLPDCASAESIRPSSAAATVIAAVPRKRRRFLLISSEILIALIFESPRLDLIDSLLNLPCRDRFLLERVLIALLILF